MDSKDGNLVKPVNSSNKFVMIAGVILVILIGLGVGFLVSSKKSEVKKPEIAGSNIVVSANEAGVKDPSIIKDVTTATGVLQMGGIKGEGLYHIERSGGATQTVYLNSTTVDMSSFVGKKVQVWGQTLSAHYAQWLMDVMKIKIVQ
jgi:hypothetical protein